MKAKLRILKKWQSCLTLVKDKVNPDIKQTVYIFITQICLQTGKILNNNKVTAIIKLARLKGHPVGLCFYL